MLHGKTAWCLFQSDAVVDWSNVFFCCLRYGVLLKNIASINKVSVRGYHRYRYAQSSNIIHTARCLELLDVKHGYSSLSLFSRDDLVYAISYLSTV